MSRILITAKINPDLDGVACAYVYAQILNATDKDNEYVAGVYDRPLIEAEYMIKRLGIKEGLVFNPQSDFDKFIMVDASDISGMPAVIRPMEVIEVIDHRDFYQTHKLFPNAKIQLESVGAAATLIWEKLDLLKINLRPDSWPLLLGAIYSNTLNFKSKTATHRDRLAVESIIKSVSIPENLISDMFNYKTKYLRDHLREVIASDFKAEGVGIAQIEGLDLRDLIIDKLAEIQIILGDLKREYQLEKIFLTVADISRGYNFIIAFDDQTKELLSNKLELIFNDQGIAQTKELMLRKEIIPLIK